MLSLRVALPSDSGVIRVLFPSSLSSFTLGAGFFQGAFQSSVVKPKGKQSQGPNDVKTCFTLLFFFSWQELSCGLDNVTQEKNNLRTRLLSLEDSVSFADNEMKVFQDKIEVVTEEKAEIENKLSSLMESSETEKQVWKKWIEAF